MLCAVRDARCKTRESPLKVCFFFCYTVCARIIRSFALRIVVTFTGGAVASCSGSGVGSWKGTLCCVLWQDTLLFGTQVYRWVPANPMLGDHAGGSPADGLASHPGWE